MQQSPDFKFVTELAMFPPATKDNKCVDPVEAWPKLLLHTQQKGRKLAFMLMPVEHPIYEVLSYGALRIKAIMCGAGVRPGRVIKPPTADASEKKMDGVLAYNEGQISFNCSFGAFQVG